MTRLARTALQPTVRRLLRGSSASRRHLESLSDPAGVTEQELAVALAELRQMRALVPDPHYLPALVAVGRAYVAATGDDPLTGTPLRPEYTGLEQELATTSEQLGHMAEDAHELRRDVRRLRGRLADARRLARRLDRRVDSVNAAASRRDAR
jgi:hypothetical protein